MGFFDKFKSKKIEASPVKKTINGDGGMSIEKLKAEQKATVEARISKWTPRQKAAFEFMRTLPSYSATLAEEKLTTQKLDVVEKFAKNPSEIIRSAKFNEESGKFEATGKIAGSSSAIA